ncbi:hypothetical protein E2C01_048030 [Portunus trituberculatus]|uniref:Uncharacterized protein n=1 Tax=Portunus trituberculatus TaxID=210409 RepID=A0A5B7GA43_PORTR|nr:hypothetical protein [Portunus trituberculatus]
MEARFFQQHFLAHRKSHYTSHIMYTTAPHMTLRHTCISDGIPDFTASHLNSQEFPVLTLLLPQTPRSTLTPAPSPTPVPRPRTTTLARTPQRHYTHILTLTCAQYSATGSFSSS